MIKNPLLSIITTNKNDNYRENTLQRLKFILNYLIYSLKKIDAEEKVEYIIVDWGSDEPLSNYFHNEISNCQSIKFINISKEEAKKYKLNFDTTKALNVGIDHCLGEHLMFTSSDQFFPLSVLANFLNLIERPHLYGLKGDEYKLIPRKYLKDDFIIYEKNMEIVDLYLRNLNHSEMQVDEFTFHDGSGAGGNLLKKNQIIKIGGIKDSDFHNHGHDNVLFHEISNYCSHIDTATFGSFLLKLPITKSGFRIKKKKEKAKIHNSLDYLEFKKKVKSINSSNIEIINYLNLPNKKRFDIKIDTSSETVNHFAFKETIRSIIECSIFTVFSEISLKSKDIHFILQLKKIIKKNKIKNIFFDEAQSLRFISCLANTFQDISFFIILDSKKHSQLDILKLRNSFASRLKFLNHYGYMRVINFNQLDIKSLNFYENYCIIEESTSKINKLSIFKKEVNTKKINTVRRTKIGSKISSYIIEDGKSYIEKNSSSFHFDILVTILIYIIKLFYKVKRFFGNIKRRLKI